MRQWTKQTWLGLALAGLLAMGAAGSAGAAPLGFTGSLQLQITTSATFAPPLTIGGAGAALVNASAAGAHLSSMGLPGGTFGPVTTVILTPSLFPRERFTGVANLSGSFAGTTGGGWGGPMGLTGLARLCIVFDPSCLYVNIPIPIAATTNGGFGIGGTQTLTGAVSITAQHAPWAIGQPVMTLHIPETGQSTISAPGAGFRHDWMSLTFIPQEGFPDGFVHGPASLTSSTAQPSGVVQLVTVSKIFTSLTGGFPELPVIGVLTLHFVPEPGTLLLLGAGAAVLAVYGRRKRGR